jgi:hypothetical protein
MKPYQANILNALVLIAMGLWAYFSTDADVRSGTALIAPAFGVLFLALTSPFKKENKAVAHIVVLLTFLLIIMLAAMPLPARVAANDTLGIVRIAAMIITSIYAMVIFIGSFRAARKAREAAEG